MAFGTRIAIEPVRQIETSLIGNTFQKLGPITTDFTRILSIGNSSTVQMDISIDGIDPHIIAMPESNKEFNFSANRINNGSLFLAKGTQFWVRNTSAGPGTGILVIEIFYAEGGK